MAAKPQLDAAGGSRKSCLIRLLLVLFFPYATGFAQDQSTEERRLAAARSAYDAGHWNEAAQIARGPADQSPEFELMRGLALARLEKWEEAKLAFEAGARKSPRDSRFPAELAGIAYRQKDFATAKSRLLASLRLNPRDAYTHEFLATIYFLEGNLEAALKYWNPEDKPRLRSVSFAPSLQLKEALRDRAVAFNAPQVLTTEALLTMQSRLDNLGVFSTRHIELTPTDTGNYDLTLHLAERNLWGDSKVEGAISLLGGLPYATVYPEMYNLGHRAVNLTSLARWDAQKRRLFVVLSAPVFGDPALRLRVYADARNENWNLSQTFFGAASLNNVNVRRITAGGEIHSVVNGRWSWSTGTEIVNHSYRNVSAGASSSSHIFFTDGTSLSGWFGVERSIVRIPEHRFSLESSAEVRAGRAFTQGLGPFARVRSSLRAHWLPQAAGDDYEMNARILTGATAGKTTLAELFQLGVERDNDLWLRGHAGTVDGRKGAGPLGRRYFLTNWEMDKDVYRNAFFRVKLGPFLDAGAIADSSGMFGSRQWLWDPGVQCKVRILGGITAVFSYGRNLRGGRGVFYGTLLRMPASPPI
jgi:tetratricopeptide (TPR) repeat protein